MFKKYLFTLCSVFIISIFATSISFGIEHQKYGDINLGQEVSGTLSKDQYGNYIRGVYKITIPHNSIIKIRAYTPPNTQQEADTNVIIFDRNPEENSWEYPASAQTAINIFGKDNTQNYGSNYFGVTADKRNDKPYTEMFSNISAGDYYIGITGGSYRFVIDTEGFLYEDDEASIDVTNTNDINYALDYKVGDTIQGQMLMNGERHQILNSSNSYDSITDDYDYFKFHVDKAGKYKLHFFTDGFLSGQVNILNQAEFVSYGYQDFDGVSKEIDPNSYGHTSTYKNHKASAREMIIEADIPSSGDYLIRVSRGMSTAGSYKFYLESPENTEPTMDYTKEWQKYFTNHKLFSSDIREVNRNYEWTIRFNSEVDLSSLNHNIYIWDTKALAEGTLSPVDIQFESVDNKSVKIKHSGQLDPNSYYYMTIGSNVKSKLGKMLPQNLIYIFKTLNQ